VTAPAPASLRHLLARLAIVESRVRRAVTARRAADPNPDDPFRGLYLTEEVVDALLAREPVILDPADEELLAGAERDADQAERAGADLRLRRLARAFELTNLDVEVLLVALAPDIDARFEQLYGYLNDDVTRRRACTGLALTLCGVPEASASGRSVFAADGPLVAGGLMVVEDLERPFLSRSIRVPDRVTSHLLGDDRPDPALAGVLVPPPPAVRSGVEALARALSAGAALTYLRERPGAAGMSLTCTAAAMIGRRALVLDLRRLAGGVHGAVGAGGAVGAELAAVAVREARLLGAVLAGAPVDALAEHGEVIRALAASPSAALAGSVSWDPSWSRSNPLLLDVGTPTVGERSALWRSCLDGQLPAELDPELATEQFLLSPEQIARAASSAALHATVRGNKLTEADLGHGARAQNAVGLGRLARRIEPAVGWPDLVLPEGTEAQLREIAIRARHRSRVLDDWGMRPGGARGRGVTALFAGDSGTGKTMSAEVIAADLGLDLYAVDLSSVIDKYVGETEKNLERIFTEAAGVNGVLLFDEADAVFGKRSEVRDAHDRYANVESAFLLQRMESFDGLAILATNLRANLDEALTRRLDLVVDFPLPDVTHRRALWDRCLGPRIPRSDDLDLDFCARAFELSGGNIRSAVVAAAYRAAKEDRAVTTVDLVAGVYREYQKLGRLTLRAEFGAYLSQLR
jgi:winged helix domain-containing protein/ATPase family protein associated with various cellular activities (AAA)